MNAWGNGFANQPFWIGNNGTGTSTLYDGYGNKVALTVSIPAAGGGTGGPVTGVVPSAAAAAFASAGKNSSFMFCSEDGIISGWNAGSSAAVLVDNSKSETVTRVAPDDQHACRLVFYAANFNSGKVDTWDDDQLVRR